MGCDIHAAIEYFDGAAWRSYLVHNPLAVLRGDEEELTASIKLDRNYNLFAILGNVRNSFDLVSITDSRGLPGDISEGTRKALSYEHSATFIMLQEILDFDWEQVYIESGTTDAVTIKEWYPRRHKLGKNFPSWWCLGTNRPHLSYYDMLDYIKKGNVKEAEVPSMFETKGHPVAVIQWAVPYSEAAEQFFELAVTPMKELAIQYGTENVRIVMDFDS